MKWMGSFHKVLDCKSFCKYIMYLHKEIGVLSNFFFLLQQKLNYADLLTVSEVRGKDAEGEKIIKILLFYI